MIDRDILLLDQLRFKDFLQAQYLLPSRLNADRAIAVKTGFQVPALSEKEAPQEAVHC